MSDEAEKPDQEEAESAPAAAESGQPVATAAATEAAETGGAVDRRDIDALLNQAEQALSSLDESSSELPPGIKPFQFQDLAGAAATGEPATLDLVRDVQLDLKIELGRTHMHLEDVLRLKEGAVVTLDKLAGDPVDIYANGRLIARGEVLVLNDNFCVRVAELIAAEAVA